MIDSLNNLISKLGYVMRHIYIHSILFKLCFSYIYGETKNTVFIERDSFLDVPVY